MVDDYRELSARRGVLAVHPRLDQFRQPSVKPIAGDGGRIEVTVIASAEGLPSVLHTN